MMSNLLKKVWESVSTRSNSSRNNLNSTSNWNYAGLSHISLSDQMYSSSTEEFDRIPLDIFMRIVKLLAPKEVAMLTAVCKSWKLIVSDNRLWVSYLQNQHLPCRDLQCG